MKTLYAFQVSPILPTRPARLIIPNSITITIFGRKHNGPVTYAAGMLLAEQNESNVVTQLKEMLHLSPALSLSLFLSLTQTPFIIPSLSLDFSLSIENNFSLSAAPQWSPTRPCLLYKTYIQQTVRTEHGSYSYVRW